ncbi:hypothetical protein [Coxiella-like endosymbiont]|uniref:hypothetical protein n=1 Tax=Coxiella-like endosymbiont TaxID=1592897 RepID=UPI00272CE49A|nr:hypothetical protein [Coxiella-like endosymbiont]
MIPKWTAIAYRYKVDIINGDGFLTELGETSIKRRIFINIIIAGRTGFIGSFMMERYLKGRSTELRLL